MDAMLLLLLAEVARVELPAFPSFFFSAYEEPPLADAGLRPAPAPVPTPEEEAPAPAPAFP